MAHLTTFLSAHEHLLHKQAQAVSGPIEQKPWWKRLGASIMDLDKKRGTWSTDPETQAAAEKVWAIRDRQRANRANAPQMPPELQRAVAPSADANRPDMMRTTPGQRASAAAVKKWTEQPVDLSGARGISKNMPDVRRYMQMMSDKGWDEKKIKEGMAPEFQAAGFFGSQEKADEVQRTIDFLAKNPAVARNYNIDPQSEAFAAATTGLGGISDAVRKTRGEELGKKLGMSGSADWMVNLADWGNKNKNWLLPAGAAVAGIGLGSYLLGGNDSDQAVRQRDPRTAMVPKWQVGDRYV